MKLIVTVTLAIAFLFWSAAASAFPPCDQWNFDRHGTIDWRPFWESAFQKECGNQEDDAMIGAHLRYLTRHNKPRCQYSLEDLTKQFACIREFLEDASGDPWGPRKNE